MTFLVETNRKSKVAENRKKLVPIVQAIIYSGRQGHALRGHRDDSQYHGEVGEFSSGRVGNFIELLNFRVQGGDTALADHLWNCPKNASYISKTTQNELINCCGKIITEQIIAEVKDSVPAGQNLFKVSKITLEQRSPNVDLTLFF